MAQVLKAFGDLWIPVLIIVIAVAFLLAIRFVASRYKKVPPNMVGIFYGRKYKDSQGNTVGFKVVSGGGRILMPLVENYTEMSTAAFQVPIDESGVPNRDNVKMNTKGVATVKISSDPKDLNKATGAFLGKTEAAIAEFIRNILKGHLRSIVGKMNIDELLRQRVEFNKKLTEESAVELKELGVNIVNLVITDIADEYGYIDALGLRTVAEAKAEAEIKVAEANKGRDISVSNAAQAAATVKAENEAKIAEAERDRDIKKAQFKASADRERAIADNALSIATAAQAQTLMVAEAARDAASAEAQVKVQEKEALRHTAELNATVIVKAEKDREAAIIAADAQQKSAVMIGEANRIRAEKEGLGSQAKQTAEAEGRKASAKATQAEREAEAAGDKAKLLATADGKKAELLAEAEGAKARLLAEAEGALKKAQAFKELDDTGRFLMILEASPKAIDAIGAAIKEFLEPTADAIGRGLGNVGEIRIIDMGGTGKDGKNVLSQFVSLPAETIFGILQKLDAAGLGEIGTKLAGMAGIDLSSILTAPSSKSKDDKKVA